MKIIKKINRCTKKNRVFLQKNERNVHFLCERFAIRLKKVHGRTAEKPRARAENNAVQLAAE